jgi:ribonuclease-3
MEDQSDPLARLEDLLGHRFSDRELLRQALRHSSAEAACWAGSYQRLEFLGDAVIGAAVARLLYEAFPAADQGELTRMRAFLIRSSALAEHTARLGLDALVEVGRSEEQGRGRERCALLEDVFEAVVGALFLDGGWEVASAFVADQLEPEVETLDERTLRLGDPKTALQEEAQARGLPLPEYREAGFTGPDHRRRWAFEVLWDGEEIARGEGVSKREAQAQAARRALARLGIVK